MKLFDLAVLQLGGYEMETVIDRGFAFGFLVPVVDALEQRLAFVLDCKIDNGRGAAMAAARVRRKSRKLSARPKGSSYGLRTMRRE